MATTPTVACYCCAVQIELLKQQHSAEMQGLRELAMQYIASMQQVRLST
jgi:hypothetical protein